MAQQEPDPSQGLPVGRIVAAFGLRGQVKVEPFTDFPARFEVGQRLRLQGEWREILACRWQKGRPYLKLEGLTSLEDAKALQWEYLYAEEEDLELDEDEYLTEDLIGLEVRTVDGEVLGQVDDVLPMPAHDVFVVGEIMIPGVKEFVKEIDLETRVMTVELIEGMRPE